MAAAYVNTSTPLPNVLKKYLERTPGDHETVSKVALKASKKATSYIEKTHVTVESKPLYLDTGFTSGLSLRGLSNMGNTCFANCIIQALIHNPLLRNYFMAGSHKRTLNCKCTITDRERPNTPKIGSNSGSTNNGPLMVGDIVEARWKGGPKWYRGIIVRQSSEPNCFDINYDDGDQEFAVPTCDIRLIPSESPNSIANFLAMIVPNSPLIDFSTLQLGKYEHHSSIIEQIFTGKLQSDVCCLKCKSISTTIDPFWDISLDIRKMPKSLSPSTMTGDCFFDLSDKGSSQNTPQRQVNVPKRFKSESTSSPLPFPMSPGYLPVAVNTLQDCLERFTQAEELGDDAKIFCQKCGSNENATKKLSLKQLPLTLCFHAKRFEHGDLTRKIDSSMSFPDVIDMRNYLSDNVRKRKRDESGFLTQHDEFEYTLYSVINHTGNMQNGHYTCYIKLPSYADQWFHFDDEVIRMVSYSEVKNSEAYMLFYQKSRLNYTK
eukprot:UC4_evm1s1251